LAGATIASQREKHIVIETAGSHLTEKKDGYWGGGQIHRKKENHRAKQRILEIHPKN
jgi:hypothetical protein